MKLFSLKQIRFWPFALICAFSCLFAFLSNPAKAQTATSPVDDAIAEVQKVVNLLLGVIVGFTNVTITPMGLSAAARIFRHVVVANV